MAYKQNAGRDDLTNPNISALTNGTDTTPSSGSNFNKALYESSRNVSNGLSASQSNEVLFNPELTTFRPRGTEVYKSNLHTTDKNLTDFTQGVPASFSKGEGRTPYLSSRFNVNPSRKNPIANTREENQLLDVRTARIGRSKADVDQFNKVQQAAYRNQVNYRNDDEDMRFRYESRNDRPIYDDIVSGQTTSRENRVTHNKPLSTAWNPNTSIAEDTAAFAVDQEAGNMGYSTDGRTIAQIDKAKEDAMAGSMLSLHPDQVRPSEKAAKRSSKVAKTLEAAFLTGSESMMNKALNSANTMSNTDEYFSRSGNEAYHNTKELDKVKNQVTEQHERMIKNYEKKSGDASSQQNSSDKLKWIAQDFKKDKASGKFSLNSNNSSNSKIIANNLFKSPALTTDITDGKKRFKF
tara:strand:- start:54 stop:1277 length:1224 start_codon:yes stop_codon:yes gene_type:complete